MKINVLLLFIILSATLSCGGKDIKNNADENKNSENMNEISISDASLNTEVSENKSFLKGLNLNNNERYIEETVTGFWDIDFPATSGSNGYFFSKYGFYIFFNFRDKENIVGRFSGTLGPWYSDDENIYISPENNFIWKNDYVKLPWGGYSVTKDNTLIVKENDRSWYPIGSMKSLIKADSDIPARMSLKYFSNMQFVDKETTFFFVSQECDLNIDVIDLEKLSAVDLYRHVTQMIFSGGNSSDYLK